MVGLVSPTGTRLVLHDRVGGSHDDIRKTYSLELAALIGAQINGDWTLEVRDVSAMDTGVLNYWILEIGYVE
jgi:subtilisin-like proprotein convertase family protein